MFDLQAAREILGKVDTPRNLLEGLFFHSPIGVQLYSAEGYSLFVNESFFRIFGSVPPPGYCVLKDEVAVRNGVDSIIRDAFSGKFTKMPVTWYDARELEHVKVAEARRCAIETFLVPIFDDRNAVKYVVFLFRDVTAEHQLDQQRLEANRKLQEAQILIERLMNGTKAVIFAKDLEGRLLLVNDQYGRVVGRDPRELIGKLEGEVIPGEAAGRFRENDLIAQNTGDSVESEECLQLPDGSFRYFLSQKFPLRDSEGKIYGVCGVATDITEVRRLEKELGQARRMESLGLLAGGVAHDFNNLLGMILLHTEALSKLCGDGEEARDLEQIRHSVERATVLVRQLLAFGRKLPMLPRPVNLSRVVGDLSYMIGKLLGEGAKLELDLSDESCTALADPARLEQVLLNLCMNSRDAVAASGRIRIRTARETLHATPEGMQLECPPGSYAVLEVEDNGKGMPPEVLERAIDPFFTTKSRTRGSGLGLSTVFGIVQESGGGLLVRSSPGFGCSVKVFLPCAEPVAEAPRGAERAPQANLTGRGAVLLVEDEELLRQITARQLRMEGYEVVEAADAAEARVRLVAHPEVQVLVCDVIMPGKTGPALVQELAAEGMLKGRGVLFVTGYSSEELRGKGFQPTSMHLLEKPFTTKRLVEMIGMALKDPLR